MLQSILPDIILEERVIFPKPVDQFSPVCWLERLHTIRILSGQRTHSHDKPTSLSLSSNIYIDLKRSFLREGGAGYCCPCTLPDTQMISQAW